MGILAGVSITCRFVILVTKQLYMKGGVAFSVIVVTHFGEQSSSGIPVRDVVWCLTDRWYILQTH